ncbi:uncharacterized protein LOC105439736 [Strongylocentrotus purpuratus]|uniref:Uncharacterized protein n=1 Tax=Strongylocentrotus purpuratus TaxID=7668 RepID=A0A7M7HEA4_STRPU|nr:uncharacterized protein LOC105439736 [Strongylocentrotus purpuratus]|eukprot:XP_011667389.1 PREDICTED: uncharacterized protein LOC105439736 [Strongylocentrotus purpuratus]
MQLGHTCFVQPRYWYNYSRSMVQYCLCLHDLTVGFHYTLADHTVKLYLTLNIFVVFKVIARNPIFAPMAEKAEEEKAPSSPENLTCPLCLDIFDGATILTSCGHTFCRKCLKNYDLSHLDLDHMICPLCRNITKLTANRVDDFLTNVTVNGLVDDYHAKCGGMDAAQEMRPKCTACKFQRDAVSFCRTCSNYMCEKCLDCHQKLTVVFEGHEIVSIQDIINGKVSVGHLSEKCCIHKQENKDMFCEECKVHVCLKCVIVGHQNHKIKNQTDFEQELRLKVNDLVERCATMKSELEKNIQNVEVQRHEVYTAVQRLLDDVGQAYSIKAKKLKENHRNLIERINAVKRSFDDDLNILKSNDLKRIKSICSSITLVDNDRLGHLETDSLYAHTLLCEELDAMLKKATDRTSAAAIKKKAQEKRFKPADDTHLDLGSISESTTDRTSAATIAKKAHEKTSKPACVTHLGIGSISKSVPKLQVIRCVGLRGSMWGMTPYSDDSVAIGYYGQHHGIDIIDSAGKQEQYANIPSNMTCYDLVFQQDRSLCISTGITKAHIYSRNGSRKSNIHMKGRSLKLNRSPSDDFLISNSAYQVYIYDPTGSTLKHTVPTKQIVSQVSSTRSGLIVTSSCYNPNVVTVYDREGNAGKSLQAPPNVGMYAAVDEQDRVYLASVKNGNVVIRLYELEGLNLKETVEFNVLNLKLSHGWCYLVSLSSDMLAFACDNKLYCIKVSL